MRAGQFVLLMIAFTLAGCDRITGAANQRILDAEAIGYACRVSQRSPEDCMKENEAQSPSSILDGWKAADKDIQGQLIDPRMGNPAAQSAPVAAESENKAMAENSSNAKNVKPVAAASKAAGH